MKSAAVIVTITAIFWLFSWFHWTPVHPKREAFIPGPQWQSVAERVATRVGH